MPELVIKELCPNLLEHSSFPFLYFFPPVYFLNIFNHFFLKFILLPSFLFLSYFLKKHKTRLKYIKITLKVGKKNTGHLSFFKGARANSPKPRFFRTGQIALPPGKILYPPLTVYVCDPAAISSRMGQLLHILENNLELT